MLAYSVSIMPLSVREWRSTAFPSMVVPIARRVGTTGMKKIVQCLCQLQSIAMYLPSTSTLTSFLACNRNQILIVSGSETWNKTDNSASFCVIGNTKESESEMMI